MRPLPALLVSLLLAAPVARAQEGEASGFAFLRLTPSARAAGMGGAYAADRGDDATALFVNPALLDAAVHRGVSVGYVNHLSDINAGFVALGWQHERLGTLGAGIRFLSWGTLEGATESGERTGSFGAADLALTVAGSRAYGERLRLGVGLEAVYSGVESYDAAALAASLGASYMAGERLWLAASVNHLGVTLSSLGDTRDRLPLDVRVSAAKRLRHLPLLLSLTAHDLQDPGGGSVEGATALDDVLGHLVVGAEIQFSPAFQLRAGYNHRRQQALSLDGRLDTAGLGIGAGIRVRGIGVDYAFDSWSSFGRLHHLSVRTTL